MYYNLRELSEAIIQNKSNIIEDYLAGKGDANIADNTGYSLLHQAAKFRRLEIAENLIKAGANVNAKIDGYKLPLNMALEVTRSLSSYGIIVNGSFRMHNEFSLKSHKVKSL